MVKKFYVINQSISIISKCFSSLSLLIIYKMSNCCKEIKIHTNVVHFYFDFFFLFRKSTLCASYTTYPYYFSSSESLIILLFVVKDDFRGFDKPYKFINIFLSFRRGWKWMVLNAIFRRICTHCTMGTLFPSYSFFWPTFYFDSTFIDVVVVRKHVTWFLVCKAIFMT